LLSLVSSSYRRPLVFLDSIFFIKKNRISVNATVWKNTVELSYTFEYRIFVNYIQKLFRNSKQEIGRSFFTPGHVRIYHRRHVRVFVSFVSRPLLYGFRDVAYAVIAEKRFFIDTQFARDVIAEFTYKTHTRTALCLNDNNTWLRKPSISGDVIVYSVDTRSCILFETITPKALLGRITVVRLANIRKLNEENDRIFFHSSG